ncbi:hypothetical protein PTSG_09924 [Salpingoeca rosetta]|uniref:PKD domain-containing protein n=1 Tax=Salpingoeca rosetta (strain ATCC 50818 / BSB-021) TaxID=946362 RepID=F2UNJ1_SALR5|nr:uncharacterized protein PTSG_09924 [Salpingoeca rosetta]EGD79196.1 hypothetical protein PTSG_09924 [Salpingoeca rosetta]|eukprot:XP_004989281.1 hypothetical protein PTSG_09924 [Salpingoeca rosetta]
MMRSRTSKAFVFGLALVCLGGAVLVAANTDKCPSMCTPDIDKNHTVIAAVPGLRGQAGIEPNYGNCPTGNHPYRWTVYWGDGVEMSKNETALMPYNAIYSYKQAGTYNVTIAYCNYPAPCCMSCSYYTKSINVTD